ncbi:MAG: protein-disulfide reductase DsbD domain-containing protein, partial [Acidobacteriota bacterium]
MSRASRSAILLPVLLALLVANTTTSAQTPSAPGRKAQVSLHASVAAVVPGEPFELAIRFKLSENWHIYWLNSGEAGFPPRITWSLPAGMIVDMVRFPVPAKHVEPGNIKTNVLEGEPILLVKVTPPEALSGESVTIAAEVNYLICEKVCVPEKAELRLELPLGEPGTPTAPANQELFEQARAALPRTESKYVTITPKVPVETLSPDQRFDLILQVRVAPGHHIQSHKPLNPSFIATELLLENPEGLSFGEPVFPKPSERSLPSVGRVSEFSGTIDIRVPVTVSD